MEIDYSEIISKNERESIFRPGPYNHCRNAKRIYLDDLGEEIKSNFDSLTDFILKKTDNLLGEYFFVCLVTYTEDKRVLFPDKELMQLKNCNIPLPSEFKFDQAYIDDDEWYSNYLFFKERKKFLRNYVKGILAPSLSPVDPLINLDVFFISSDLKILINLYDDRGMDIVELKS